jgi:hypothetical protein
VVQNYQVGRAAPGFTVSSLLAQLGKQLPGVQDRRRDAAADVAHHHRLSEVETENIARVDPGIDATDNPQRLVARERQAGERAVGGEPSVSSDQLLGGDGHRHRLTAA